MRLPPLSQMPGLRDCLSTGSKTETDRQCAYCGRDCQFLLARPSSTGDVLKCDATSHSKSNRYYGDRHYTRPPSKSGEETPPIAKRPTASTAIIRHIGCFGSNSCSSPSTKLSHIPDIKDLDVCIDYLCGSRVPYCKVEQSAWCIEHQCWGFAASSCHESLVNGL
jgi:hypothetical protein